jgi:hypothetical protein
MIPIISGVFSVIVETLALQRLVTMQLTMMTTTMRTMTTTTAAVVCFSYTPV